MTTPHALVPPGIGHTLDLSSTPASDLAKHHRHQLRTIGYRQGLEGIADYKRKHPDAAHIRVRLEALAYSPKPSGYRAALVGMVRQWYDSEEALSATNRADVERLNEQLGTDRFNPDNHFSKPLSPSDLKALNTELASLGIPIPRDVNTMAKIRKAVRAARVGTQPGMKPLGNIGTISGDTLTIRGQNFAVQRHKGRDFIRPTIRGAKRRLYLDELEWLADLITGGETVETLLSYSTRVVGERATYPISASPDPLEIEVGHGLQYTGERATSAELPSLSDRITRLVSNRENGPPDALPSSIDPLEIF